jgi:type I restriction enzyme M protein
MSYLGRFSLDAAIEKNQLLGLVSWRDEAAAKMVKKVYELKYNAVADLLHVLNTSKENLADFVYWPIREVDNG